MIDEICIVQLSDTHVCMPNCLIKNNIDSNYALERVVELLNAEDYRVDCVLITGDLVQGGSEDEYRH